MQTYARGSLSDSWLPLTVAVSERGVARVQLGVAQPVPGQESAPALLVEALRQLREYLEGKRRVFALPVDLEGLTPFQRAVLCQCQQIKWGEVCSYGALAERVAGSRRAARAVGQALAANPVPILVPCHRVVCSDGSLGGFAAGLSWKRRLLEFERQPGPTRISPSPDRPAGRRREMPKQKRTCITHQA
jgi:methylated-DNA-[protein]-cysteine S-methyltransferase